MTKVRFDHADPLYDLFLAFHSGELKGEDRQRAKMALFHIHYSGQFDYSEALSIAKAKGKKDENN